MDSNQFEDIIMGDTYKLKDGTTCAVFQNELNRRDEDNEVEK